MGDKQNNKTQNQEINNPNLILQEDFESLHSRQLARAAIRDLSAVVHNWIKNRELKHERRSNDA